MAGFPVDADGEIHLGSYSICLDFYCALNHYSIVLSVHDSKIYSAM